MRGRRAELKTIRGGLADVPAPTDHVPPEMAEEWNIVAADLQGRKLLTASMVGVLETYVIARWTVRQAQAAIAEHGVLIKALHGQLKPNPAAGMLTQAQASVARLAAEMGLTPASRSRKALQPHEGGGDANQVPAGVD